MEKESFSPEIFHQWRKSSGISLRELQHRSGISHATIHRFEKGGEVLKSTYLSLKKVWEEFNYSSCDFGIEKNIFSSREILVCECHSLEHQVALWFDNEEKSLYIEPRLVTHKNFFKRLWGGLRYAFGYKTRSGDWDEIIIDPEGQKRIVEIIMANYNYSTKETIDHLKDVPKDVLGQVAKRMFGKGE